MHANGLGLTLWIEHAHLLLICNCVLLSWADLRALLAVVRLSGCYISFVSLRNTVPGKQRP
jgi:hypothetical protein